MTQKWSVPNQGFAALFIALGLSFFLMTTILRLCDRQFTDALAEALRIIVAFKIARGLLEFIELTWRGFIWLHGWHDFSSIHNVYRRHG